MINPKGLALAMSQCDDYTLVGEAKQLVVRCLMGALPWRPISELTTETRYGDEHGFLLLAPELVDEDCNVHGVGMGYWQDGAGPEIEQDPFDGSGGGTSQPLHDGSWMACKWSMTNDEWAHVPCNPTHYIRLTGADNA